MAATAPIGQIGPTTAAVAATVPTGKTIALASIVPIGTTAVPVVTVQDGPTTVVFAAVVPLGPTISPVADLGVPIGCGEVPTPVLVAVNGFKCATAIGIPTGPMIPTVAAISNLFLISP